MELHSGFKLLGNIDFNGYSISGASIISGATIIGNTIISNNTYGYQMGFDTNAYPRVYYSSDDYIFINSAGTSSSIIVNNITTNAGIKATNIISGSNIFMTGNIKSEGLISGANIFASETISGSNLVAYSTTSGSGVIAGSVFVGAWNDGPTYAVYAHKNFRTTNSNTKYAFIQDSTGQSYFNSGGGNSLNFSIDGARKMVLNGVNFNFVIGGTYTPTAKLEVVGMISGASIIAKNGFTGTGAYNNFTISGGIILSAS